MKFQRSDHLVAPRRPALGRVVAGPVVFVAALSLGLLACGTTDEASRETLPPLETTTTTTSTTSTIPQDRFYTVERGDILAVIAAKYEVTVEALVELNELSSPDAIQAGQVLEIPANVRE